MTKARIIDADGWESPFPSIDAALMELKRRVSRDPEGTIGSRIEYDAPSYVYGTRYHVNKNSNIVRGKMK